MTRRRQFLVAAATLAAPALLRAQQPGPHDHHSGQFERLAEPGRMGLPAIHAQQAVTESPAPRAAQPGRWQPRAPLPIPRTEMAWAVAYRGRVHLVGGYAEQRVDKPYHHAYDLKADAWEELPQLPRGANHVGVATLGDRLYAFGGFVEQNRTPHDEAYAFDGTRWNRLRRLPEACGAMACIAL
ncbi:MAG: galactose oxidase, partial [Rubrivivax sp.]|nr:galactose oxidase [Rubrivivax sp.]